MTDLRVIIAERRAEGGVVSYVAYLTNGLSHWYHSSTREADVRIWLKERGVPFTSQPELVVYEEGKT